METLALMKQNKLHVSGISGGNGQQREIARAWKEYQYYHCNQQEPLRRPVVSHRRKSPWSVGRSVCTIAVRATIPNGAVASFLPLSPLPSPTAEFLFPYPS